MDKMQQQIELATAQGWQKHFERMLKISARVHKRAHRRITLTGQIELEERSASRPVSEQTGFEAMNIRYYNDRLRFNEMMIGLLKNEMLIKHRTHPTNEQA